MSHKRDHDEYEVFERLFPTTSLEGLRAKEMRGVSKGDANEDSMPCDPPTRIRNFRGDDEEELLNHFGHDVCALT